MILDIHVHAVGNGSSGSGCWLRSPVARRPLQALMVRHIGLPGSALRGDLDNLYTARLLECIRKSSLHGVVLLAQEMPYDESGKVMADRGTAFVPNDYVLSLADKHPELLPAVSIHPAREDALEELERCAAAGAVMMKCLPNCQNIDCRNPKYRPFWERMAELGMPLMAHTGGEHVLDVVRPELADPRILSTPLECGVTVIAAHCAAKSGLTDPQYFHLLPSLFQRYPNLFVDVSAMNIPLRARLLRQCLRDPYRDRIIHGSDFPVPVFGHFALLSGLLSWNQFWHWQRHPNPLERDYQFKRAMGFKDPVFTRATRLLRLGGRKNGSER